MMLRLWTVIGACVLQGVQAQSPEDWEPKLKVLQRLEPENLKAAHDDAARIEKSRRVVTLQTGYTDYKGILHAHAEDASHTGGTRPEMLADAKAAGVEVIFLSDHFRPPKDFITETWRGMHEGVLFVPGSESHGFLIHPTASVMDKMDLPKDEFIPTITADGGLIFLSHVEERVDHPMDGLDGMEIYNRHADATDDTASMFGLIAMMLDPERAEVLKQSLNDYPAEVLAIQLHYPDLYLAKFDREAQLQHVSGVAANDCHHNQVFIVKKVDEETVRVGTIVDDDEGMRKFSSGQFPGIPKLVAGHAVGDIVVRLDFDPYVQSFDNVSTHILAVEQTEPAMRDALRRGRAYVSHDWMCDPTGFAFGVADVEQPGQLAAVMGDEYPFRSGVALAAEFPVEAHYRIVKDGEVVETGLGRKLTYAPSGPGVYRLEGWLEVGGERRPWLYTNHVYLK